jgi:branched-chain amino acid transport system ATP-binding protein
VADHLCRRFRGVTAVADVSLRVATGARFGIIGPNGAGKTTLFNLLSGELRPTTGSVALFGRDITRLRTYRRATLGLGRTFQITRIFSDLTVLENLTLALHGLSPSKFSLLRPWRSYRAMTAEAAELAASFGLAQRLAAPASDLSHGEVRELEVLLALALKPRVLLLDEPAAGLSPAERVDIQALLTSLPAELTLIMIEHDIDVLRGVVDSAAVLHLGSLVIQGTMRDIQNDERVRELYLGGAASRAPAIPPPGDTPLDASTPQAGPSEASPPEVGTAEAGPPEASPPEVGTAEAGPPEVGTAEAGTAEASPPEVGTAEASPPEAAPPGGKP